MLTIWTKERCPASKKLTRRGFLQVGGLGLAGLSLADLLRLKAQGAEVPHSEQKSVIMVVLGGGLSHHDTYDMKPDAPAEIRGEFRPIRTNVPGIELCELLPLQAQIADKLAIVRNITVRATFHSSQEIITGYYGRDVHRPAFGSVVSRLRQGGQTLPPYVSLMSGLALGAEKPEYLGEAYKPFVPNTEGLNSLSPTRGVSVQRVTDRRALLGMVDNLSRELDAGGELAAMDAFTTQALDIITSPNAREAFDIGREPERVRNMYGKATNLLMARRLVEAGVSVVTVYFPGPVVRDGQSVGSGDWDTHVNNFPRLRIKLPDLDQGVHALITDLYDRGLDRNVLVIFMGEFGRTPRINDKGGRDHWPSANFAIASGGGLRTGQVIGETDAQGGRPRGVPYTPQNILSSLYHVLGINPATTLPDFNGRPQYLLDERDRIEELF